MPLQKILFKPGVNKENTRYTTEGGWYDCDKVRFRQGTPEKIGGWQQISAYTYEGTCRSLWTWDSLGGINYIGVGTNLKFYIAQGGEYNDITPLRAVQVGLSGPFSAVPAQTFTVTIASPAVLTPSSLATVVDGMAFTFTTTGSLPTGLTTGVTYYAVDSSSNTCKLALTLNGSPITTTGTQSGTHTLSCTTVTVTDNSHGALDGDFVNFLGAVALSTQTFTRSSATNFVLTTALAQNTQVILTISAGGALPTGLAENTPYYINVVSGTTVNFTNVPNGAAISTSSAGSGTFSLYVNSGITAEVLNQSFQITVLTTNTYTIESPVAAGVYDTGNGGSPVNAYYEINVGKDAAQPLTGWGAGPWGDGAWGYGTESTSPIRIWSQANFGQDLIFAYRGGPMYYWNASIGTTPNPVTITIAAPGVLTLNVGGLSDGMAIVLLTTGALPTGLTSGTVYYVGGASGSTFRLATTYANAIAGTYITTSGTQSGTQYVSSYAIPVTSLGGASAVPAQVNFVMVSDASRFTIAFGATPYASTDPNLDPMLIRWSDQESVVEWTPAATNQAGFIRLSHGSEIRTAVQARQEIVVFTDASVYSLQYLGPPYVWGSQLLGDNISIAGFNTAVIASGVIYWMGIDKFYKYDGRVATLRCDLRQYIFQDINLDQQSQFFAGTNEGFNEVWWFYCSSGSTVIDKYAVYNYAEDIWYYGTLGRTAWLDSGINQYPIGATYANNLVYHEYGVDDNTTETPAVIESYITSSEFDIGDGHNFGFVWRMIPDITFRGSSATSPQVTMTLKPLQDSGSGYNNPESEGGVNYGTVTRTATVPIEQFTQYVYIRVRGRQMSFRVDGNQLGLQWQLGAPRIDIKPDGRRGS